MFCMRKTIGADRTKTLMFSLTQLKYTGVINERTGSSEIKMFTKSRITSPPLYMIVSSTTSHKSQISLWNVGLVWVYCQFASIFYVQNVKIDAFHPICVIYVRKYMDTILIYFIGIGTILSGASQQRLMKSADFVNQGKAYFQKRFG